MKTFDEALRAVTHVSAEEDKHVDPSQSTAVVKQTAFQTDIENSDFLLHGILPTMLEGWNRLIIKHEQEGEEIDLKKGLYMLMLNAFGLGVAVGVEMEKMEMELDDK